VIGDAVVAESPEGLPAAARVRAEPDRFYLPQLDALRCCAFFLVFLHHAPPFPGSRAVSLVQQSGWAGVDLFFVLSAYLLVALLDREHAATGTVDVGAFFIRRILRIWPLFYAYIAACFLYFLVDDGARAGTIARRTLGHLLFADNVITVVAREYNPLNFTPHLWTIAFEEQIYLVMPLLFAAIVWLRRHPLLFAGTTLAIVVSQPLLREQFADNQYALWVLPLLHFEAVLAGLLLGAGVGRRFHARVPADLVLIAGAVVLALVAWVPHDAALLASLPHRDVYVFAPVALGCFLIVLGCLSPGSRVARLLARPPWVFLGRISYGLYVWHLTGLQFGRWFAGVLPIPEHALAAWLMVVVPALVWTVAAAVLSYFLLERPFLRMKRRFTIVPNRVD
jgi:peptidoglycan/LPS O-acetylase OafA/YrhL